MLDLKEMKSITLKNNDFGPIVLDRLVAFLSRPLENRLHTLRLIKCKTTPSISHKVVQTLTEMGHVANLALVDAKLREPSIHLIG